jgi:pimeloyl-ACP methyl ester carboxylesterase
LSHLALLAGAVVGPGCAQPLRPVAPHTAYILYLPGASGYTLIDDNFLAGLRRAIPEPTTRIERYDWTPSFPNGPLDALRDDEVHNLAAQRVAKLLEGRIAAAPPMPVDVVAHSAGTGIAVYALQRLPTGTRIRNLILLSSALSDSYDLSPALSHISGSVFVYTSPTDNILPFTQLFGTVDRPTTRAAGLTGFSSTDPKLVTLTYQPAWRQLGYQGDHISILSPDFAQTQLAAHLTLPPNAK